MLEVIDVSKAFDQVQAVDQVSFQLAPGQIMGLIGQNGSGKTTLFRLILDFLNSDGQGRVLWQGQPYNREAMENDIGYLPEERGLFEDISIQDQVLLFGQLRGLTKQEVASRLEFWLDAFAVKGNPKDKIKTLSKGNQQKIQVIASIIHEPDLVILDEPFSGLDPVNADLLKQAILRLKDQGAAIIFSSHNMANVEELCDQLLMIHHGRQVLSGPGDEVRMSFGRNRINLETDKWSQEDLASLEGVNHLDRLSHNRYRLHLADESYGPAIFDQVSGGDYLVEFSQQAPSLEEIFKIKAGEGNE